jgi:hypothetical protein
MSQLFWYVFQWAVAVGGGIAIAEAIQACCYEPSYMDAPRFYLVSGVIAFALFSGPATLIVGKLLEKAVRAHAFRAQEVDDLLLAAPRRKRLFGLLNVKRRRRAE